MRAVFKSCVQSLLRSKAAQRPIDKILVDVKDGFPKFKFLIFGKCRGREEGKEKGEREEERAFEDTRKKFKREIQKHEEGN